MLWLRPSKTIMSVDTNSSRCSLMIMSLNSRSTLTTTESLLKRTSEIIAKTELSSLPWEPESRMKSHRHQVAKVSLRKKKWNKGNERKAAPSKRKLLENQSTNRLPNLFLKSLKKDLPQPMKLPEKGSLMRAQWLPSSQKAPFPWYRRSSGQFQRSTRLLKFWGRKARGWEHHRSRRLQPRRRKDPATQKKSIQVSSF